MRFLDKIFASDNTGRATDTVPGIDELIMKNPANPNNYIRKGDLFQKEGRYKEAVEAYHLAASLLEKSGFFKKALILYKIILRIDNNDEKAAFNINKLLSEFQSLDTTNVSSYTAGEPPSPQQPDFMPAGMPADKPIADPGETYENTACKGSLIEEPPPENKKAVVATDTAEDVSGISDNDFFRTFTGEELQEIFHRAKVSHYNGNDLVVAEGETGDSLYVIKNGAAKVISNLLNRNIQLATLTRGDVFGEVAFLTGRPRTASVIASGLLALYEIDRRLIEDMIEQRPEIMDYLNEVYHLRVKETIQKVRNECSSKKS